MSTNNITGVVGNWKIVSLSTQEAIDKIYPGEQLTPSVLVGTVVEDYALRFRPGQSFRSSLIKSVDLENNLIYTRNSVYQLQGSPCDGAEAILEDELFVHKMANMGVPIH